MRALRGLDKELDCEALLLTQVTTATTKSIGISPDRCKRHGLMTQDQLIDLLARHRTIGGAPREELAWIATHGRLVHYEPGDIVVRETDSVDKLLVLLSGCVSIYMHRGGGRRKMMDWKGGDVTGLLPYSRLKNPPGDTYVEEPVDAVEVDRKDLPEMIRNCHEITSILVHVMTDRARRFTSVALRDEKMISLGTLAAGLAHELNNPASAAMRNAEMLATSFAAAMDAARAIGATGLSKAQIAVLDDVWRICMENTNHRPLTGLALADREDAIAAWLEDHALNPAPAEDLAKTCLTIDTLNRLAQSIHGSALEAGLRWIASAYAARSLVIDIPRATSRIHSLVAATKGFTNMDRSSDQDAVDIAHGLLDTVSLLDGKARERSVTISVNIPPDLPPVWGFGAEINQIWMNLIDNAIYAAPSPGNVSITAAQEGTEIVVSVADDGEGIPADIREKIFDPFFTTKPVGEGTGLGLDIVQRVVRWHNGEIGGDSRPGRTEFRVKLPAMENND